MLLFTFLVVFPLALFGVFSMILPSKSVFEFDWGGHKGVFSFLYSAYRAIFGVIFLLGLCGGMFFADQHVTFLAIVLFSAALQAFLFIVLLTFWYESYLHARWKFATDQQSNYTTMRYAIILALGTSSVLLFVYGLLAAFLTML